MTNPTYENIPLPNTPQTLTTAQAAARAGYNTAYFRALMVKVHNAGIDLRTPTTPGENQRTGPHTYDLDKLNAWIAEGKPIPKNTTPKPKPNARTIHATATHTRNTWTITMDEIGTNTTAENLHTGHLQAHALAVQKTGLSPDEITIHMHYEIPPEAATKWEQAKAKETEAQEAAALAARLSRQAVKELQAHGISYRNIGTMLGISAQRAQQLGTEGNQP